MKFEVSTRDESHVCTQLDASNTAVQIATKARTHWPAEAAVTVEDDDLGLIIAS
jgi:hypothetical protein